MSLTIPSKLDSFRKFEFFQPVSDKVHALLQRKFAHVLLPDEKVHDIIIDLMRWSSLFASREVLDYRWLEIEHYATTDDILNARLSQASEQRYVQELYKVADQDQVATHMEKIQTPEQTFGSDIKGIVCPRCKMDKVTMVRIQKRSKDEPEHYFYQCTNTEPSTCGNKWSVN